MITNKRILITGGAGFIGCNLASTLMPENDVYIVDNLSRTGVQHNLEWLQSQGAFQFIEGDVRDYQRMQEIIGENAFDVIFHLAAQVAVTTSVKSPRDDLETNILGTFNILESVRTISPSTIMMFTSTNKVYGALAGLDIVLDEKKRHYRFANGIAVTEDAPLDFHSPYGCSKGAADQYVRDYARIFDLNTVVFRMSCIYGPHQMGNEDQGWVAHFVVSSLLEEPITIYGDGMQVRDILYVDDLIRALCLAVEKINITRGQVYNIGGGPQNAISLLELVSFLEELQRKPIPLYFEDWRPGDQRVYISDISKAFGDLGWKPDVNKREGITKLYRWAQDNLSKIRQARGL